MISESILEGDKVRLRPVREGDLEHFQRWLQDAEVRRWLAAMNEPPSMQDEIDWYEATRASENNVLWSIETLSGRLIGSVELRLTLAHQRAELGISIHDKSQWNKGFGTETVALVVEYAFDDLELNRVELTTDEDNVRGRRAYEKAGFVEEGLLRQHRLIEGKLGNTVMMAILRSDWERKD